ncbi:MAG: tetratricopeptide repeat protein [Vicinamibacteria bacterium]|nr:tetratricopeptide repeat protein [Vicinamibacteria bacterium]
MKKALKKQIKQDEFVTTFERAHAWMRSHVEETRATMIGAVILAGVIGGLAYYRADRQRSAAHAFGEAVEIFEAPVRSDPSEGAGMTSGLSFASNAEKYNRAMTAFDGIVERYASLPQGQRARYFAALSRIELNRLDEAAKALEEIAKTKSVDAGLARLALADLNQRRGETDRAVDAYKLLLAEQDSAVPRDHVLMRLAAALEDAGRTDEAAETYRRVTLDNPQSAYSSEAERRADFLVAKDKG